MLLTKEVIEAQKLDENQVKAIDAAISDEVATEKKGFDTKANDDAEAIIQGAMEKTITLTGIQRDPKEKYADYLGRVGVLHITSQVTSEKKKFDDATTALDQKIKDSKPDELIAGKLADMTEKHDNLQKKEAEYDRVTGGDFETKLQTEQQKNASLSEGMAFGGVKPNFPDTVNQYEAVAKWDEFKDQTLTVWHLEFDENHVPICVSKENKHKNIKLSDLVDKDEKITALKTGRNLKGFEKNTDVDLITIDKVPFKVPANATPKQRRERIQKYLTQERTPPLAVIDKADAVEYDKYTRLLLGQKTAKT